MALHGNWFPTVDLKLEKQIEFTDGDKQMFISLVLERHADCRRCYTKEILDFVSDMGKCDHFISCQSLSSTRGSPETGAFFFLMTYEEVLQALEYLGGNFSLVIVRP